MNKGILLQVCFLSSIFCFLLLIGGCEQQLRFAPSESQKQNAELTYLLASKINTEGTAPQSPASEKLVRSTQAFVSYTGRPKEAPNPEQFDTIANQAQIDAQQRPDAWQFADAALELGIGISSLLGGVYGTRAVKYLQQARAKSKALKEIIDGNEIFKTNVDESVKTAFAKAQNTAQVTKETKQIVAATKLAG